MTRRSVRYIHIAPSPGNHMPRPHIDVSPASLAGLTPGQTQQLTAIAYGPTGAAVSAAFAWTTSDTSVATVDASGLVTMAGPGSCAITATALGMSGSASMAVIDEVAFATTAFGSSLKYLNSVAFNLSSAIGGDGHTRMTQLQDARGGAFGQTYTPTTGNNGAEVVGSGKTKELQSSNGSDMRTPAVAGDAVGPVTYAFVGRYSRNAPGGLSFPWGLSDDALSTSLLLTQADGSAEKGGFEVLTNPSALYTHSSVPRDGRPRLIIVTIDATGLVRICSPGSPAAPGPIYTRQLSGGQIPSATAVRRWFGGVPGFSAISSESYRGDLALTRVVSLAANSADLRSLITWASGYHGAINGSQVRVYVLGTSLDIGYTNVAGGAVDLSQNWSSLMLQGASFNGAKPYVQLNLAVTAATIRSGTNAGNNAFDVQLPLLQQHYDASAAVCIVIVALGTNDLASNLIGAGYTDSGNSALADVRSLCAAIRALGPNIRIVVAPCPPRNAQGGAGGQTRFDTDKHTFNNGLAAQYATFADAYASELLTVAPLNIDTGYLDSSCFDGIHFYPYTAFSQGMSPAVLRIAA